MIDEKELREYKEHFFNSKYFNSLSKGKKTLTMFKVIQWKFIKHPFGWRHKSRINPYNPLTYIVLIAVIPIAAIHFIVIRLPEFMSTFKYH